MGLSINEDEIKRKRKEILERGRLEAPDELDEIEDLDDEPKPPPPPKPARVTALSVLPPGPAAADAAARDLEESDRRDLERLARNQELADRLLRGRYEGAKRGKHQSGPAPYGYRRVYTQRETKLEIHEEEAEVVRFIFREYLRVRSMKKLIKLLETGGHKTRRGCAWSRAGISWILKNNTYVGRVHFGDVRTRGLHTPIVSPIIFNKVQKLIHVNDKRAARREAARAPSTETTNVHPSSTHLTDGPKPE